MLLVAHRGRVAGWPENASESIPAALGQSDGLEVDVRLTADEVPILMHDPGIQRPTGDVVQIHEMSASELLEYPVHGCAPVPSLHGYLGAALAHDAPLVLLDLKNPTDACLEATVAACEGFPQERLLLAVRTDAALQALRTLVPTGRLASLGVTNDTVDARIAGAQACAAEALFIHHGDAAYERHRAAVATIRSHGLIAGASTLRTARAVDLADTDGCGLALVDLPLTTPEETF